MGFQAVIGGFIHELENYSVQEASSPLSSSDSSGQVGTITLTVKSPDLDVPGRDSNLRVFGPQILVGKSVRLTDTRKGFTLGKVTSVSDPRGGSFTLNCESRLGELNIYNVQAQPFVGTLGDAFDYYVSIANITTDVFVDPDIASMPVVFPGWFGELWYNMKLMASAIDAEVSLVSGVILLRPIRRRVATRGRDLDRSLNVGGQTAQSIEIYEYNNRQITNELVYPPGGWSEDVAVVNVNAGEYVEQRLELSASVSSVQQPVMQTFVARNYDVSSVYTIVGDDGLPIDPLAWSDNGGSLRIVINEDTTSLTVQVQAPTGVLPNRDGEPIGVYSVSLSSDNSTGRYSTLRIIGTGVAYNKNLIRIPTGLTPQQTGTEVGMTIDNPFVGFGQVYIAGARAAKQFTGRVMTLSGTVVAVNQLGDSGVATYPSYEFVQAEFAGMTYANVQTLYAAKTYAEVQADWFALVRNDFENQVFGNVAGARVWDKRSKRWFRIRTGTLNPGPISFTADDDLIYTDVDSAFESYTYAGIQALMNSLTYSEATLSGLVTQ